MSDSTENKPDGGYGWIILIVAFLISFILDGCMYSFGIVLNEIKIHFHVTQDVVNLVQSLNVGFLFMSGPISAGLAAQFGCRIVVMVSAMIFGIMYTLCAFLPSIYIMIFTFGVIGGISFGCTYLTCFIILVDFFDKRLGIATGLTMAGSGMGAFAFAPFTQFLITNFGWQDTMVILGSITLQCCVLGALLRPVEHFQKRNKKSTIEMQALNSNDGDLNSDDEDRKGAETLKAKKSVKEILVSIVKNMTDFRLLRENSSFFLISLSNFFVFFVYFIPFIYIPVRARELGIENYPWIISIIGIVNIPFRIIFGVLADRRFVTAVNMNTLCTLGACITLFIFYALTNFSMQACFAVVYAIAIAGMNCLSTPYVVEIVGSKKFSNGNGILNMLRGFGCIIGPYIAGYLSERTSTVFYSFFFAGSSYVVAFGLCAAVGVKQFVDKVNEIKKKSFRIGH